MFEKRYTQKKKVHVKKKGTRKKKKVHVKKKGTRKKKERYT